MTQNFKRTCFDSLVFCFIILLQLYWQHSSHYVEKLPAGRRVSMVISSLVILSMTENKNKNCSGSVVFFVSFYYKCVFIVKLQQKYLKSAVCRKKILIMLRLIVTIAFSTLTMGYPYYFFQLFCALKCPCTTLRTALYNTIFSITTRHIFYLQSINLYFNAFIVFLNLVSMLKLTLCIYFIVLQP
jgi:hypothetical protein